MPWRDRGRGTADVAAKLPFVTKGQRLLLWISAIIGINVAAWLFGESPLAAVAVAVASVFSAYTAMKPSDEPLAPLEGIARVVLWVAALLAGAFGALTIVFIFSGGPRQEEVLFTFTLAFSFVGVSVALIRWLGMRV